MTFFCFIGRNFAKLSVPVFRHSDLFQLTTEQWSVRPVKHWLDTLNETSGTRASVLSVIDRQAVWFINAKYIPSVRTTDLYMIAETAVYSSRPIVIDYRYIYTK